MPGSSYNILFPIETINRDLDFKLFLAVLFSRPGRRIYLGQHNVLDSLVPMMRGGLYLGKNLFKSEFPDCSLECYRMLKRQGFSVVHLDEEGALYPGERDEWRRMLDRRLDVGVLAADDFVCTWGAFQTAHYRERAAGPAPQIRLTGHPRFDLYKPGYRAFYQEEAARLRERYGRFLLLNTNLTLANNAFGLEDSFSPRYYYGADPAQRLEAVRAWAHTSSVLAKFVTLVHRLCLEFPDFSVVVRPHPAESQGFYETVLHGVANAHVVHQGPVGPWIIACEALIHDGCTTAIEAHYADRLVVNYNAVPDPVQEFKIPNQFGIKCRSEEEVVAVVGGVRSQRLEYPAPRASLEARELMVNFEALAFDPLLGVMEEALSGCAPGPTAPGDALVRLRERTRTLKEAARGVVRPLFPKKMRHYLACRYQFYGLDRASIAEKLQKIQAMTGRKVRFQQLSDSLVIVDAA